VAHCGIANRHRGRPLNQLDKPHVKRISSRWLWLPKWVFPLLWFGFLANFAYTSYTENTGDPDPMIFVVPIGMAIFGFIFLKKLVWALVDAVYD
jgi:hypothetical protein